MIEINEQLQKNEAEIIAEEVLQALQSVDLIALEIAKIADNKRLYGRTAKEWLAFFEINIHTHPDPLQIQEYCSFINERLQLAYKYKLRTMQHFATYKASYEEKKAIEINRLANRKDRKVMPASDTLVLAAESNLGNRKIMHDQFQLYIDFWQNIIYKLKDTLELVRIAAMSNGTLLKAERGTY